MKFASKEMEVKNTTHKSTQKSYRTHLTFVAAPLIIILSLYFFYLTQAYYFSIEHSYIVLRAGVDKLTFLPGFGRLVIQTDFKIQDLSNNRCKGLGQEKVSGFWFLHSKEKYQLWGDQVADCLKPEIRAKWLRLLRNPTYNIEILSQSAVSSEDSMVASHDESVLEQLAKSKPELFTPDFIQSLTALLTDKNINVRSSAASVLRQLAETNPGSFTPEIIQSLTDLLINQSYIMHSGQTILILGSLAPSKPEVRKSLAGLLNEKDSVVRYRAAFALEQLARNDPTSVPVELVPGLLALLSDKDSNVRSMAVSALGQMAKTRPKFFTLEMIQPLIPLFGDKEYHVRAGAASALGGLAQTRPEFFTPEIVQSLTILLADQESFVRSNAARALGQLVVTRPEYFTAETVHTLMNLLTDGGAFVPCSAAFALSKLAQTKPELFTPDTVQSLTPWLTDEDLGVRSNVASALGELAQRNSGAFTPDIVQGLITLLQNEDSAAQCGAASVLGILAQEKPEIIQGLFRLLENDQSSIARNGASDALFVADVKNTHEKDLTEDVLEKLVRSPQPYLRAAASQTLEMIAIGDLIQEARTHPEQVDLIITKLKSLKDLDESLHEEHLRFAAQFVLTEVESIQSKNK